MLFKDKSWSLVDLHFTSGNFVCVMVRNTEENYLCCCEVVPATEEVRAEKEYCTGAGQEAPLALLPAHLDP